LQDLEYLSFCLSVQPTKFSDQATTINGSQLVEYHLPVFSLKATRNPRRVCLSFGGHGRHYDGPDVMVDLVRRNDQTGPRLADFAAKRWDRD
jgi:hypothetical protein